MLNKSILIIQCFLKSPRSAYRLNADYFSRLDGDDNALYMMIMIASHSDDDNDCYHDDADPYHDGDDPYHDEVHIVHK